MPAIGTITHATSKPALPVNKTDMPDQTTEKAKGVANHFLGQMPVGAAQTVLSFVSNADMERLEALNRVSMIGFLHADGLSNAAFLDQLESRQNQGIPMTFAEHQRCAKLIQDEYTQRYIQGGRMANRSASETEMRLASIVRHIDCSGGIVGDYELQTIVDRYPNLESLQLRRLQNPHQISDRGMALIGRLSRLLSLTLLDQKNITVEGFAKIRELPITCLVSDDDGLVKYFSS